MKTEHTNSHVLLTSILMTRAFPLSDHILQLQHINTNVQDNVEEHSPSHQREIRQMLFPMDFMVLISCVVLLIVQSCHGSEIIGGKEVAPHSMPFMALMRPTYCGGILIHPKWVLTAAHCKNIKKVILGVHSIKGKEKDSRQVHEVKSFPHPSYDATKMINDLMLLKLYKPAMRTKTVKCLPLGDTNKYPAAGTSCLVAGWGKTNNNATTPSDVLRSVHVTVIDREKCNSPKNYNGKPVITSGQICAGSVVGKEVADTCRGDSGGPLLCNGALVGVTSFGKVDKLGIKQYPGVYSFLSKKQTIWIKKTMKKSEI